MHRVTDNLLIRPFEKKDLIAVKDFCDRAIGKDYYSVPELETILERSQSIQPKTQQKLMCSLVLVEEKNGQEIVKGMRLTYPPGKWSKGKGQKLRPDLWSVPMEQTAYFQSLFLDTDLQGKGLGIELSKASMAILRELGAKAIVCHSWKESPHNSSSRYLEKMGFKTVATHPLYWKEVDYVCTRCGKPCLCTAEEMIYYL